MEKFNVNDYVFVPDPNEKLGDLHKHHFIGRIINIDPEKKTCFIKDQEGDVFEIELERIFLEE